MASTLRLSSLIRTTATRAHAPHRLFTSSVIRREEASTVAAVAQKKPIGGIRGGCTLLLILIEFLLKIYLVELSDFYLASLLPHLMLHTTC